MPTELLYRDDAYATECAARVLKAGPEGVLLDRTVFYAQAGGQPGDAGTLAWEGGEMPVARAVKGPEDTVLHLPAGGAAALPPVGAGVVARLDWALRHRHMRMHTSLHLLCSLIPGAGVTGGQIWTMDADGDDKEQVTRISTGASGPVWSRDGRWIAFASEVYPECSNDECNRLEDQKVENNRVKAKVTPSRGAPTLRPVRVASPVRS